MAAAEPKIACRGLWKLFGPGPESAAEAFLARHPSPTPEALAAVHELVSAGNSLLVEGAVSRDGAAALRDQVQAMDAVFGVFMPAEERLSAEEQALFEERQEARRNRQFEKADAARARLEALGIVLEDTPRGTRWHRK